MKRVQRLQDGAARLQAWLLPILALVLPLSTSGVTITALLILLAWMVEGRFWEKGKEILANPLCLAVLALLALMVMGVFWSPDLASGLQELKKNWKIALLPVLLTAAAKSSRRTVLWSYVLGLSLAVALTLLVRAGLVRYGDVSPTHLTHGTFHVVYNPLLALGIYLVLHEMIWGGYNRWLRLGQACLAAVMIGDMFITEGRTGQLVFFVLMGLLMVQVLADRGVRILPGLAAALVVVPLLFLTGYRLSPVFQARVRTACAEVACFQENPGTSVGMRLLFWRNSLRIIRAHPWLGVGTGGFRQAYEQVNREFSPAQIATDNPHNQYILVMIMLGLPGLISLLLIFAVMFRQAVRLDPRWRRVRVAFPLFFLVIMLTESYLKVYETGFLFSLFGAVFYRRGSVLSPAAAHGPCWLILSYRANIPGSACSQHLDDRLPHFREQGIEPILLTGPVGERSTRWRHFRTISLAPSGIRFEVRHFLRRHLRKRWQFKVAETLILLPVFPFYLLEKLIINLESEWSWFLWAAVRGTFLCRRFQPGVIYSTGGSASAHVAGLLISRRTGIRWLAETQDPLVHDHDWQRSRLVLALYQRLEKMIARRADHFIFLVEAARRHAADRVGRPDMGVVIYPGGRPESFGTATYRKNSHCHFAHFGSLAGTRNLEVFFRALAGLIREEPEIGRLARVDVYGSFDGLSERTMRELQLEDVVRVHGPVAREKALAAMESVDCLLLIQNIIYFSCETIPSKVYEYLLAGRPILALLYQNDELAAMLDSDHHRCVPADDRQAVQAGIRSMLDRYQHTDFSSRPDGRWLVRDAVSRLIELGRGGRP